MQVVSKIEQPTSPSSSLSSPSISPESSKDFIQIITKLLLQGQQSAQLLWSFFNERPAGFKVEDLQAHLHHHSLVALNSFKDALSISKSFDFDHEDVIRKRKLDCTNNIQSFHHCKADDSGSGTISKERRGCYKRRRTGHSWTVEATDLVHDGHAWRKYGQKEILNTKFPRHYYRCTHKHEQDCQATKQVQQISENPTKYNIIYNGLHTCKNLHKNSSIIINPEENSSFFLCFETNNYPTVKKGLNSSNLFPSSAFQSNPAMVKQEYTSIKEELSISPDLDHLSGTHSNLQCSSSSENLPSSSDLTSSTPVSVSDHDQGDSFDYDDDLVNFMMNMDHTHIHLDEIMKYPIN